MQQWPICKAPSPGILTTLPRGGSSNFIHYQQADHTLIDTHTAPAAHRRTRSIHADTVGRQLVVGSRVVRRVALFREALSEAVDVAANQRRQLNLMRFLESISGLLGMQRLGDV